MSAATKRVRNYMTLIFLVLFGAACEKSDIYREVDDQKADHLIQSNSGLTFYNRLIQQNELQNLLRSEGPLTMWVPNDESFRLSGYTEASLLSSQNSRWGESLVKYSLADGTFRLEKLPFAFNTAVKSRNGHYIYLSRWVPELGDTVYSVNGAPVLKTSVESSNAIVHILGSIPAINTFDNLSDRIANSGDLTLFARALFVSGMDTLLRKPGSYTVFAPNNTAMQAYGWSTLEEVSKADKAELAEVIRRHILPDVYFRNDFRLLTAFGERNVSVDLDFFNPETQKVVEYIGALGDRGYFTTKMLSGQEATLSYARGNTILNAEQQLVIDRLSISIGQVSAVAQVDQKDMVSDNGVVHVVNKVLPKN